ncbi:MAG: hypothetical protein INQ03_24800 [Candidatus Heimdallarchaeota archaeon]|nr:hypothetical protein [Candidatus Heimdallarchaeota archaeon]
MTTDAIIPEGHIDDLEENLLAEISRDNIEAWEIVKRDPMMVLILNRVIRRFQENLEQLDSEQLKFYEKYKKEANELFLLNQKKQELGPALFSELLLDQWRDEFDKNDISPINQTIQFNLEYITLEYDNIAPDVKTKITKEKILDFYNRVISLQEYEESRMRKTFHTLSPHLNNMMDSILSHNDLMSVDAELQALLEISTYSAMGAKTFRKLCSEMLYFKLVGIFNAGSEDLRYRLAPWLQLTQTIMKQ